MITPLDIQNKEFSRVVRGYKEEEVDMFLDIITVDMEKLIEENRSLKEQLSKLSGDINKYRGSEDTVLGTLEAAKALMSDISASAEKRAQILLKNAELDAQLIQREARESVERLMEESVQMGNTLASFKIKYRSFLESELERFDSLTSELFFENEFGKVSSVALNEQPDKNYFNKKDGELNSNLDRTLVLDKILDK